MAGATLDTGHALYSNLLFAMGDDGASGLKCLVQDAAGTLNGSASVVTDGTYGQTLRTTGSGDSLTFTNNNAWDGFTACTWFVWCKNVKTNATVSEWVVNMSGGGDDNYEIEWQANENTRVQIWISGTGYVADTIGDGLDDGTAGAIATNWNAWGFRWEGSAGNIQQLINNTRGTGTSASGTNTDSAHALTLGNVWDGDIAYAYLFDKELTLTEWDDLVADPGGLFSSGSSVAPLAHHHLRQMEG